MKLSLSTFLPPDTTYFYGYPAGDTGSFYNGVPPWVEELVSARPFVCAGDDVQIAAFAEPSRDRILRFLEEIGVSLLPRDRIIAIPPCIDASIEGPDRNAAIITALSRQMRERSLVMAQPFDDEHLRDRCAIDPDVTRWLNDKANMREYIPGAYLPETYASYASGTAFAADVQNYTPCVVKVASSSSGDGVAVCRLTEDLAMARRKFKDVRGSIIVQEYIESQENLCVQFGIPAGPEKPVEVIGATRQLTSPMGEFLGGVISQQNGIPPTMRDLLVNRILPAVRARGWYGIGAIDALIIDDERYKFIDPNFRMNATTAPLVQVVNGEVKRNMIAFNGTYPGQPEDLHDIVRMGDDYQLLNIIALTYGRGLVRMSAALLFDQKETIHETAIALQQRGIRSDVLQRFSSPV